MHLTFYSSAFCGPCAQTRAVLERVTELVPSVHVTELDVVRAEEQAERENIHMTPTVILSDDVGTELFRASGAPTINQVLTAIAASS